MEEKEFSQKVLALAREGGLVLAEEQVQMCYRHVRLMLEWNQRINLTRITDWEEIIVRHLLDSFFPAHLLPQEGSALDVGTGAGFPGIPLKILFPDLEMVLLEGTRKKVSFLRVVLAQLSLKNCRAIQGRWEDFAQPDCASSRGSYTLITMRAVRLQPEHLCILACRLLQPGGVFAWWAGPGVKPAWGEGHPSSEPISLKFEGSFLYSLPSIIKPRCLYLWRKALSVDGPNGHKSLPSHTVT